VASPTGLQRPGKSAVTQAASRKVIGVSGCRWPADVDTEKAVDIPTPYDVTMHGH
jgi:hypothetical protein